MKHLIKTLMIISVPIILAGCTEAELVSHVVKSTISPSSSTQHVGYFKVGNPYKIQGKRYYPKESYDLVETGIASWYGPGFHGKMTANGEIFDENELTAAHRTLQMPSMIRATNLDNGRSIILRVNDRGPFSRGRILDVSKRGAELLGFKKAGTARIRVEVLGEESRYLANLAKQGQSTKGTEIAANKNTLPVNIQKQPLINTPQNPDQQYAFDGNLKPADMTNAPGQIPATKDIIREELPQPPQQVQQLPFAPPKGVFVQAGSFSNQNNATNVASALSQYNATISPIDVGGRTLYRVRIPASSTRDADMILSHLASQGNTDAIIVVE